MANTVMIVVIRQMPILPAPKLSFSKNDILGLTFSFMVTSCASQNMVLFFLKFQYYKFFIMFLFIAMILGKFQANRKENEEIAKRDAEKLEKLLEEEKQKKEELLKINRDLKNQIITSRGGVISFQNIRKSLNLLTTVEQVLTKSINIINQFMNCENASIYIVKNQNLNQIIKIGNSSLGKILNLSEVQADRFLMTLEKGETLEFALDLKGEKPVFVAPIFYGKKIIALLEITKLSYETSKNENFELFKIIMEEINNSLSRIFSENEKNNIHNCSNINTCILSNNISFCKLEIRKT